jgi:hypothetical protein
MTRSLPLFALAAALAALACTTPAVAGIVSWNVDPAASFLRLSVPDQLISLNNAVLDLRVRNSNNSAWNDAGGRRAFLDGTIVTQLNDGNSIEFLSGQHSLVALEDHSLRPNPAAFNPSLTSSLNPDGQYSNATTAPAAFGARVRVFIGGTSRSG